MTDRVIEAAAAMPWTELGVAGGVGVMLLLLLATMGR